MTTTSILRDHPALTPVEFGPHTLSNRLAVAPMTRVSATPDGTPTAEMAEYYAAFAEGGFGLVITEGVHPDDAASQGYLNQPGLVTPAHVAGWRAVTDRVHAAGGTIVAQLMHAGALSQGNRNGVPTVAPSPVDPRGAMMPEYGGGGPWPRPRELGVGEIADVVAGFAAAAGRAREAGFDGVEVHAANGYLLDQFLTDYTNLRTDDYGGSAQNRVRITAEVVAAIVAAEPGLLVGVRLSQTKVNDFSYRWPDVRRTAETFFRALAASGAQYLHIASEGRNWLHSARLDDGSTITGLAREVTGLPVVANGGMADPAQARDVLAGGHADVLSIGHGALANPDLPRRLAQGVEPERFERAMLEPMVTLQNARRWRQSRAQ